MKFVSFPLQLSSPCACMEEKTWLKWCLMTSNVSLGKTMHILLFLLGHWPEGIKLPWRKSHYSKQLYEDRKQVTSYRLPHRTQHQMLIESLPSVPVLPWDWLGWVLSTSTFVSISMVATPLFWSSLLYMDISLSCLYKMITLKREKFCQLIFFFIFSALKKVHFGDYMKCSSCVNLNNRPFPLLLVCNIW